MIIMRLFGKVLQTLHMSRRQSNLKSCRGFSVLCFHNLDGRDSKHVSTRAVASKSNSSGKGSDNAQIAKILPVALLQSKSPQTAINIMLIPLNLSDKDEENSNKTMKTLSIIREHTRQIEAFTENLTDTSKPLHYSISVSTNNRRALVDQRSEHEDSVLWTRDEEASNDAEGETKRIEAPDCDDGKAWNNSKQDLLVFAPECLEEKLQQMAISSIQLAFEMDMSNIRDAILRDAITKDINLCKPTTPKSLPDPTLTMSANLDVGKDETQNTTPLDFNALIQGTVEIDPSKYTPANLGEIKVPEFNDCVTAIAANICSTALQKGFPADFSRMAYSTNTSTSGECGKERNPHIVCIRDGSKGCVSPGNANYPKFVPKNDSSSGASSKQDALSDKAGSTCISSDNSLLSSSEIIGYDSRGLMNCKAYARALAEAAKRRGKMANNCKSSCGEKETVKKEAMRKKDKCGDAKNNPCTKPLTDECGNEIKKDCPDRKKDEKQKKKKDSCKDDPCKKADGTGGEAYQLSSKSKTPCGGKNQKNDKSKEKEKSSPCGAPKKKGGRCNSETDACKMEKECPKPKKKECDLGDPCDPCQKPTQKTPEKPKKTCSSAEPTLHSEKAPITGKQTAENSEKEITNKSAKCGNSSRSSAAPNEMECKPFSSVKNDNKLSQKSSCERKYQPPEKSASDSQCGSPESAPNKGVSKPSCAKEEKSANDKSNSECQPAKKLCDAKQAKSPCSTNKKSSDESEPKCQRNKTENKENWNGNSGGKCSMNKKATAPNCKGKPGSGHAFPAGSGCKKYSTLTNPKPITEILPNKRFFSHTPAYTIPRGLMSWRQFGSKKGSKGNKGKGDNANCIQFQQKKRSKRVDILARKTPKNCYTEVEDMCQDAKKLCKDPKKSSCAKNKKENEKSSLLNLKTHSLVIGALNSTEKRYYGSDTIKETRKCPCYEDEAKNNGETYRRGNENKMECETETEAESDECVFVEDDSNLINKTKNEVIRILEPCTVERCLEAMPNFSEYDVIVRTTAVALSGSDLHYYETGGSYCSGMTLGHDATGVVEEVGCCIQTIRPGDRVVVESGLTCGICDYCKRGCYNICNHMMFNGFLRKYQVHPADLCHKIPEDVDLIEATLTQTLAKERILYKKRKFVNKNVTSNIRDQESENYEEFCGEFPLLLSLLFSCKILITFRECDVC